jgi:type I restriction enzyme S subunit
MRFGLSEEQFREIIDFISKYPEVEKAVIFGSRAIGTFKEASDVDIALFGADVDFLLAAKLKFDIEEDTYLPFMFDFAAYPAITNEALRKHIDTKGVVIFRRGEGEWKETSLGQACSNISYGYTASAAQEPVGPKFLRITDIVPSQIDWDSVPFCKADVGTFEKYKLKNGDIVIARTGATTGYNKTIKNLAYNAVFASCLIRYQIDPTKADSYFIGHILQSSDWYSYVEAIAGGSAQPGANAKQLGSFEFLLPPLPEQKAIASVLSSLDDKIDLLHRQNKTLEAIAETLFRQWFVEEAQEDWESRGLLDVVQLVGGGTPKTSVPDYWNGDVPWLAGGDIATNHKSFVNDSEKKITEDGLCNSSAKLLPQFATVISARGTVGKYCLLAGPMAFSQSNYGILPNIRECFFFTYLLINHVVEELQSSAYGSVFDTITTNTFKDIKMSLPDNPVIEEFEKGVVPFFQKILTNKGQIAILEKLRDTLLPKLMSGEVRVAA